MSSAPQPVLDELITTLNKRTKRTFFLLIVIACLLVAATGTSVLFLSRKLKQIDKSQKTIQFDQFVTDYKSSTDFVQPTVNTIQFLRRGYSITFDSVDYTQDGLVLSGRIGNPTQLWVSSLALNFSARPWPYRIRDKWMTEKYRLLRWSKDWNFGTAQTKVGDLNPGSTAFFKVTIPNVKQTADGLEIAVFFSGERYQYLGR